MNRPRISLREDRTGQVVCAHCGSSADTGDVDRLRWCADCVRAARARATRRGWQVGAVATVALAMWLWFAVQPTSLVPGGWLATLVAAFWIIGRVARELFFGLERMTPPARP